MCGKVAVNIFGIISGFYSKRENKLYKGLRIEKQTVLTSWIFLAIYLLINITIDREVGFGQIIQCVFPILLGQYWFVSAFILVLLFSPYIDKCVDNFSDKEIKGFLVLTFLVWCLISRLPFQSNMQYGWNQYLWLIYMYFIGRILNRYEAVWLKYISFQSKWDARCTVDQMIADAISYIRSVDLERLSLGRHQINDSTYFMLQEYVTKPVDECRFESHKNHIDVQWILHGVERIDISNIDRLIAEEEEYNSKKDVTFWKSPNNSCNCVITSGSYVVLYPEDAHRPCVAVDSPEKVRKLVIKICI